MPCLCRLPSCCTYVGSCQWLKALAELRLCECQCCFHHSWGCAQLITLSLALGWWRRHAKFLWSLYICFINLKKRRCTILCEPHISLYNSSAVISIIGALHQDSRTGCHVLWEDLRWVFVLIGCPSRLCASSHPLQPILWCSHWSSVTESGLHPWSQVGGQWQEAPSWECSLWLGVCADDDQALVAGVRVNFKTMLDATYVSVL